MQATITFEFKFGQAKPGGHGVHVYEKLNSMINPNISNSNLKLHKHHEAILNRPFYQAPSLRRPLFNTSPFRTT